MKLGIAAPSTPTPILIFGIFLIMLLNDTPIFATNINPPPANSCDFLTNAGFENGNAQGWLSTGRVSVNQQYVGEGTYGAYVERGIIYQNFPYNTGCTAYELRVFSGIHSYDNYNQEVFVKFLDANGNVLLEVSERVTNFVEDGPLQEYDLFATPPAGTTTVQVGADSKNGRYVKLDAFCLSGTCAPPCTVSIDNVSATDCAFGQYSADVTFSFSNAVGAININGCTFMPTGNTGTETFKILGLPCGENANQGINVQFVDDANCAATSSVTAPCPKPKICVKKLR